MSKRQYIQLTNSAPLNSGSSRKTGSKYRGQKAVLIDEGKCESIYVFDGSDDEVTEEELWELRSRTAPQYQRRKLSDDEDGQEESSSTTAKKLVFPDTFVEKDIEEGESLQSISLKYSCPISELKRVNNIIKEQEFFALRKIKIPSKPYGLLTELVDAEAGPSCVRNGSIPSQEPSSVEDDEDSETEVFTRTISIKDLYKDKEQSNQAKIFLQQMDKDLAKMRRKAESQTIKASMEEVTEALTSTRFYPLNDECPGSDWGIVWWKPVLLLLVILIVLPMIYGFYFHFKGGINDSK